MCHLLGSLNALQEIPLEVFRCGAYAERESIDAEGRYESGKLRGLLI